MEQDSMMIHVRFAPDGSVMEIGERPPGLTAQAWFNLLSDKALGQYQVFAGGRGLFRLSRERVQELKMAA
jgi:hypothetical protein